VSSTGNAAHYNPTAKALHWLVAGMIVVQFVLAKLAELAGDDGHAMRELALLANHKSVGITILVLAVVRIAWRLMNPPPALPVTMPKWQVNASQASHWSLYFLLFAMPITGWLMSSASAYSVSWFNLFQLPDFVAPSEGLKEIFEETHETLAKVLILVASIHVIAAIKHAMIDKDGMLQRIISAISLAVFVAVIAIGTIWLGNAGKGSGLPSEDAQSRTHEDEAGRLTNVDAGIELPLWQIDYAASHIIFSGSQSGAEFEGVWQSWSADMHFAADQIDKSSFTVTVDTTSAATQDVDRDTTLADPDWFDSANFPEAYFRTGHFSDPGDGTYVADGQLTIKGVASPVQLAFRVAIQDGKQVLTGSAQLDRLALGVGTGEWLDTIWVGQDVTVQVRVEATLPR